MNNECKRFAGELLPCPCCGSDELDFAENKTAKQPSDYIACNSATGCGLMIARVDTLDGDLAGAWNRRAAQPAPVVPEGWMVELGFDVLDRPFRFVDSKSHTPTIKVILPACEVDDSSAWDLRDGVAARISAMLAAAPAQGQQVERVFGDEDHVSIPRGLIGAACSAIDKKRDALQVLTELRRYTFGDLAHKVECQECERLRFSLEVAKTDELDAAVYAATESLKHELWDAQAELAALKAQQAEQKPVAWKFVAVDEAHDVPRTYGRICESERDLAGAVKHYEEIGASVTVTPLYTAPQPAPAQDVAGLVEALHECLGVLELHRLTGQVYRNGQAALAAPDKQSGGEV